MNNSYKIVKDMYDSLMRGSLNLITDENKRFINTIAVGFLNTENPTEDQLNIIELILKISNILYNNCTTEWLVIEDGVYDVVLVKYEKYRKSYPVGAPPIQFTQATYNNIEENIETRSLFHILNNRENALYYNDILRNDYNPKDFIEIKDDLKTMDASRISRNTPHNYPKLVGTLDKCKFVLNDQVRQLGLFDDPSIKIFERDFIDKHLEMGIISPDEVFDMVIELKYDGVSVEADVTDRVISARSRGDTAADLASDFTPIFEGYPFKRIYGQQMDQIGMKFEAIITKHNLDLLSDLKGKDYKNCRNAIVGIVGSLDGRQYRDLITLVPLATSLDFDSRIDEINFLNTYYTSGQYLNYAVLHGNYIQILFQVKKFVEEAEYLRGMMPFMYDGVVVSYIDKNKIARLGRENSINKYSMAIKFNTMKKQTVFLGYSYTIGQNGMITPMLHYQPVEFYGTIHTKSSGHSYARFNELNLAPGDIVTVEYTNDVMPYVTKPDLEVNHNNPNPPIPFITHCPYCGTELVVSETGKAIFCPNINCTERNIMRMSNLLAKLKFKDFSEQSLRALNVSDLESLADLRNQQQKVVDILGDVNGLKFCEHLYELFAAPIYDYEVIGSLGFSSIALGKWKLIFKHFTIDQILNMPLEDFTNAIIQIKGIGPGMVETIKTELPYFVKEIKLSLQLFTNIIPYCTVKESVKIRFTGFRDQKLVDIVKQKYPYVDIGEGSVTKDTNILLIPMEGHTSTKTVKAAKDGVQIVVVSDFINNMDKYIL